MKQVDINNKHHNTLWLATKKLPEDYVPYGANERWKDPDKSYPDCSGGCKHFYKLAARNKAELGFDWGVCANPKSHRCGLLTFEHQGCEYAE